MLVEVYILDLTRDCLVLVDVDWIVVTSGRMRLAAKLTRQVTRRTRPSRLLAARPRICPSRRRSSVLVGIAFGTNYMEEMYSEDQKSLAQGGSAMVCNCARP